ncbi:hypothetical protein K6U15_10065, partial [Vibrio parahaemolyticus]|uniref:hypothetical protein n=1 Tax=Vibrio parahaemolyticus TaxID=670 RepID=UPI001EEBD432|nr:hypothetical protein [Vibrio parahaemolyticus]
MVDITFYNRITEVGATESILNVYQPCQRRLNFVGVGLGAPALAIGGVTHPGIPQQLESFLQGTL